MTDLDWATAAARLGLYIALIFLFGALAFRTLVARADLEVLLARQLRPAMLAAAVMVVLSVALSLPLLAGTVAGDWSGTFDGPTLAGLLAVPAIGAVWLVRLNLAGLLLICLFFRALPPAGPFLIATALLASLAWTGHAVMQDGAIGWLHVVNHMAHLLAAGLWLGSLPSLLVTLRALGDKALRGRAMDALRRFSSIGHVAVACVVATGIVNVWLILGAWPLDWGWPYQLLLATKIALVGLMATTALVNRYVFTPRIGGDEPAALHSIARGTVVEIVLGLGVLALVAVFGLLEPV